MRRQRFLVVLVTVGLLVPLLCAFDVSVKRRKKTRQEAAGHVARDEASRGAAGGFTQSLQSYQNIEYRGSILVGTPPQKFEVIMDTGSDVFWLPRVGCRASGVDVESCRSGLDLYDPRVSSSAVDLHQRFSIAYGTGSAIGTYFSDVLSFGDSPSNSLALGNVTVGAASQITFSDQGILGLSFSQPNDPPPVFMLAVQRGVFAEPIFTVYLADCDEDTCEDGGQIKFGGVDTTHCDAVSGDVQVTGNSPYWMFNLDGISVNQRTLSVGSKLPVSARATAASRLLVKLARRSGLHFCKIEGELAKLYVAVM